jgi:hypothetical protein
MAPNHSQSVAELRRESERTRAELTQTVDTLKGKITDTADDIRHKVSPEHIKAEVSSYVAEKSRSWLDSVKQQAMDNPMQALAAGTAIAVPAFKIIRSVPLPLLMIGAGLALASPKVRGAVADKVSEGLKASGGSELIDDAKGKARDAWQSAASQVEGKMDDARSAVASASAETRETAAHVADDVRKRVADMGDTARGTLSSAQETMSSTLSSVSDTAKDAFETARTRATETASMAATGAANVVRDHAALVGGLGLAIGALIAASLPATRTERDTIGAASDALRKRASGAASEQFDHLKETAMSAVDHATEKFADAGERMSRTAEETTEKLKTVADEAITTAFEPSQTEHR